VLEKKEKKRKEKKRKEKKKRYVIGSLKVSIRVKK
jgi:hypothetical protein